MRQLPPPTTDRHPPGSSVVSPTHEIAGSTVRWNISFRIYSISWCGPLHRTCHPTQAMVEFSAVVRLWLPCYNGKTRYIGTLYIGTLYTGTLYIGTLYIGKCFTGQRYVGLPTAHASLPEDCRPCDQRCSLSTSRAVIHHLHPPVTRSGRSLSRPRRWSTLVVRVARKCGARWFWFRLEDR